MKNITRRDCPICGGRPSKIAFPYSTRFNGYEFFYVQCLLCATVFVDPVPDQDMFKQMYAKQAYHDNHYSEIRQLDYKSSAELLARYLMPGRRVLDYGCGVGAFLEACRECGFIPFGVDFDPDVARAAGMHADCQSMSVCEFETKGADYAFDAIHLGDVLEHLPDPLTTLCSLVERLSVGGILYVEGPLERNSSPVYWATVIFGKIKKTIKPKQVANHPPTHLLRTDAVAQRKFFSRVNGDLEIKVWQITETGWPYSNGGFIKRLISGLARKLGERHIVGVHFGNRFQAILMKHSAGKHDISRLT